MAVAPALAAAGGGGVGIGTIIGGIGTLGGLMGGKDAKRQGDKALSQSADQAAWVKSLYNDRKQQIEAVKAWADEQGLLSPQAMWDKTDSATAASRARDSKNLVANLFKTGGYKHGETAAENILANAELAHASQRDQQYLSMAIDSFGRRLTLAAAPSDTSLIGQSVQAGQHQSDMLLQNSQANRAGAYGALGGLGDAWAKWEAYNQTRKQAQSTVEGAMPSGPQGDMGFGQYNTQGMDQSYNFPQGSAGAFG